MSEVANLFDALDVLDVFHPGREDYRDRASVG